MALFTLYSYLTLPREAFLLLSRGVDAQERTATALARLVERIEEPEEQAAIDRLTERLRASNSALAEEVTKILTQTTGA